jgi:hypothetical protein
LRTVVSLERWSADGTQGREARGARREVGV